MTSSDIQLIGLPYLMGRRAPGEGYQIAEGPDILLSQDSMPLLLAEHGYNVETQLLEGLDDPSPDDTGGDHRLLPVGDQMSRVLVQLSGLARAVTAAIHNGKFPLIAGGTCSSAMGVVGGISATTEEPIGMIWFDAHADAQTPDTSVNGFIEGMPVSTIAGLCWPRWRRQIPGFREIPEENIVTVGNHEVYGEGGRPGDWHGEALGTVVDPPVIQELGYTTAIQRALNGLKEKAVSKVFVHFDTDVIDENELAANSHSAPGGISVRQAIEALELIGSQFEIIAFNLTAWDPHVDPRGRRVVEEIFLAAAKVAAPLA